MQEHNRVDIFDGAAHRCARVGSHDIDTLGFELRKVFEGVEPIVQIGQARGILRMENKQTDPALAHASDFRDENVGDLFRGMAIAEG